METSEGARRKIPSVDTLLRSEPGKRASASLGRALVKRALQTVLEQIRSDAEHGTLPPDDDTILARAAGVASSAKNGLAPVINATGVILHTGLGRAPLPPSAAHAAARAGAGYGDLEVDRATGARGRRTARAELMLQALTQAEGALVVNNGAAAVLLALAALARGKHVLVSRGKLLEVGTTNRTRPSDFAAAISDRAALLLKVHPSNYRVVGFTAAPSLPQLVALSRRTRVPVLYDLGSGLLDRLAGIPEDEPSATEALADGADLVTFSGDKLLGGPQAGIVLGRSELVERMRRHPIARAVRVDKMQVAALESVLATYLTERRRELPTWRMIDEPADAVRARAERLSEALDGELEGAHVIACESAVGGGSLPGSSIPSFGVEVRVPEPEAMATRLRVGRPPVFCRVNEKGVVFDLRTVPEEELPDLRRAIQYALEGDDLDDD